MEYNDIIDTKIGKLLVKKLIRVEKQDRRNNYIYLCECECGNIIEIVRCNLITGHTKSCGCLKKRRGKNNKCWKGFGDISSRLWTSILSKAKSRNLDFNITIEDAWSKFVEQKGKCALTGLPIVLDSRDKTASLDRIDNSKGYEKDNIQWLHKDINWMKGVFGVDRFIDLCCLVAKGKR